MSGPAGWHPGRGRDDTRTPGAVPGSEGAPGFAAAPRSGGSAHPGDAPLRVWSSDHVEVPLPDGHPFPIAKYRMLRERLIAEGTLDPRHVSRSEPAPVEWLAATHDERYLERVLDGTLTDAELRRIGMPWSPGLVERARCASYGTAMAAGAALDHGVAGNLAGGTHHAYRDRGEGYCLFNDHAVAIARLRAAGGALRPFVADLDVHQGNGTAAIFADDETVYTFSIHGDRNYPSPKERGSFDLALPDGTGDAAYLAALDAHLPRALDLHEPDIVFYQAGVDPLASDRFGRLGMTHDGLRDRDARVFRWCEERSLPVVVTLGGGYARPIEATVEAHANVWREARAARSRRAG
jgi:acetoin utilization deacetylase AcuC-like enzyme